MSTGNVSRRAFLRCGTAAAVACATPLGLRADEEQRGFKIGVCDWSLNRQQDLAALELAGHLGIDGVQVSFGEPGSRYDLRQPEVRREYAEACRQFGVQIASLGMGVLNSRPYASDPEVEQWVLDGIDVCREMNQKVMLLAFFYKGDLVDNPAAQREVVRRLKRAAPQAERAGVVLGIESWLNADQHLRILDAVGSPAVQVYYDVANMEQRGYDIYKEIRQLGRDRICEIHAKENGFLLGQGKVDFVRVKKTLDEIGWSGWLVIESAVGEGKSLEESYRLNQQYLRSVFPT
jgi:L-ribulose-5-phosphate 3-epimerase